MRYLVLVALLLTAACSQATPAVVTASLSPVGATCRLPVWWSVGQDLHSGFVNVPDGAVTDAGLLPQPIESSGLGGTYGATYLRSTDKWIRAGRDAVSPDGRQFAYWSGDPTRYEVHVVDLATRVDHVAYGGTTPYIVVSFQSDGIYLAHSINARQGAFEKLYRLDPAGGTPQLVTGSDRHMYQYGWVLVADGAAWGIDNRVVGNDYYYSVLRLDLATSQVTRWMEGPPNKMFWPQGVDSNHRLYAAPFDGPLWRIDSPDQSAQLASPAKLFFGGSIGGPPTFEADSKGVWLSGQLGIWRYADGQEPKRFAEGINNIVWPAGPCA